MKRLLHSISIIKARWPEVIFITGLNALAALCIFMFIATSKEEFTLYQFMYLTLALILGIFSVIAEVGFLRTAYLNPIEPKMPQQLLTTGRPFFWRIFIFDAIYNAACFLIGKLFLSGLPLFVPVVSNSEDTALWISQLCFIAARFVLIKFAILIPVIIIATDSPLQLSFGFVKELSLKKAPELIILFAIESALVFAAALIPETPGSISPLYMVLTVLYSVVGYLIGFAIALTALKFVAESVPATQEKENNLDTVEQEFSGE